MNNVVVKKDDLLTKVRANRDEHVAIFEESMKNWEKEVREVLTQAAADVKEEKEVDWKKINQVQHDKPDSHVKEYDQAIAMLELEQRDELELDQQTFAQLVQDEWHWQRGFLASASNYSRSAVAKMSSL